MSQSQSPPLRTSTGKRRHGWMIRSQTQGAGWWCGKSLHSRLSLRVQIQPRAASCVARDGLLSWSLEPVCMKYSVCGMDPIDGSLRRILFFTKKPRAGFLRGATSHLSLPQPWTPIPASLAFSGGRSRIAQSLIVFSLCVSIQWVLFLLHPPILSPTCCSQLSP